MSDDRIRWRRDPPTAYAGFDRQTGRGMEFARVMAVCCAIELTVKQSSAIDRVVTSVEGKAEGVLRP